MKMDRSGHKGKGSTRTMSTYFNPAHGIKCSFDVGDGEAGQRCMVRFGSETKDGPHKFLAVSNMRPL